MSKIGKQPVAIPAGVTVTVDGQKITVKGPKGELSRIIPAGITAEVAEGKVVYSRADDSRPLRSLHGLSRTLCANMVQGVTAGYKKELSIEGTGFKAQLQGNKLLLSLGFASSSPSRAATRRSSARRPPASAATTRPNPTRARASSTSAKSSAASRARRWPSAA